MTLPTMAKSRELVIELSELPDYGKKSPNDEKRREGSDTAHAQDQDNKSVSMRFYPTRFTKSRSSHKDNTAAIAGEGSKPAAPPSGDSN